jgi:hypothetical protein
MLRRNIQTDDGLVNGAQGTVVGFDWGAGGHARRRDPDAIFVQFDDPRVGRMFRIQAGEEVQSEGPVRIEPVVARFKGTNGASLTRRQYPMCLAWALTIHRVQGLSLDRAVIDLGDSCWLPGQAYVALSRLRSLDGVALLDLDEAAVRHVAPEVIQEYQRLRIYPLNDASGPSARPNLTTGQEALDRLWSAVDGPEQHDPPPPPDSPDLCVPASPDGPLSPTPPALDEVGAGGLSPDIVEVVPPGVDVEQQRRDIVERRALSLRRRHELFTVRNVAGDGDCLFRALANLRFGDENYMQKEMRVATAQFAALHWGFFQTSVVFVAPNGSDIAFADRWDYVRRFSVPGNLWSSFGEVRALANVLQVRIRVWSLNGEEDLFWPSHVYPSASPQSFPEYNILFTGNHYQSLVPRGAIPSHLCVTPEADRRAVTAEAGHNWHRALALVGIACAAALAGTGNMWYGHDMSTWPPSNIVDAATGEAATLSWFYMPLILYALGVDCPRFTFHRPPIFLHFVNRFTAEFQRRGITWESLQESGDVDGDFHLTAAKQEELIDMLPGLTLEIAQYVYDLQHR